MTVKYKTNGTKQQHPRRGGNPRNTLRELLTKRPHLGPLVIKEMCRDATAADQDQLDAIFEYWYGNNYRSLTIELDTPPEVKRQERVQGKLKAGEVATEVKESMTKLVLLDMVMFNGKKLRDCTGSDCRKGGGWLTSLSLVIKPNQKVGSGLSEDQVQARFRAQA